ncbi:nuclear transport factor 2 family protein [Halomicrobium salinisoli]|uniref:nuclear transport factor 2 family protein n=1 Tax=Halomicrobium salinisoli TaxID=2878391 RepID=UPI001CF00863|nr:nuclear transport factor 2 family protein [Halomicrobium salinisoli]
MDEGDADSAAATVRRYYESLREGEPLAPFFADDPDVVKYGLSERLVGDEVQSGLREQTERTEGWTVESRALRVTERDAHAWFSDQVFMGWTDAERRIRYEFETRWSGTLERRSDGEPAADGEWRFVGMHVSTTEAL